MLSSFVLETCNSPGTSSFTCAGAPVGRRTWASGFANGALAYYSADSGDAAEWGVTTVSIGPPTVLSRAVIGNTSGNTTALNFTGSVRVFNAPLGDRLLYADQTLTWTAQSRRLANLAAGTGIADAPRMDQVGWVQIGATVTLTGGTGGCIFNLPTASYNRWRVEYEDAAPASSAQMYMRVSIDGANYVATNDYTQTLFQGVSGTAVSSTSTISYAQLTPATVGAVFGEVTFQGDGNHEFLTRSVAPTASGLSMFTSGGSINVPSSTVTNVLVGAVGANMNTGRFRLLGCKFA